MSQSEEELAEVVELNAIWHGDDPVSYVCQVCPDTDYVQLDVIDNDLYVTVVSEEVPDGQSICVAPHDVKSVVAWLVSHFPGSI